MIYFCLLSLLFFFSDESDRLKFAPRIAISAFGALLLMNIVNLFLIAGDGVNRTLPCTNCTSGALLLDDLVGKKVLAHLGRAFFLVDVGLILITEIPDGGQNRIRRSLSQSAQRARLDLER
jgi:hypothetical protein